jgi:multiple sugar transport system permease protein
MVVPLSTLTLATVAIFTLRGSWDEYNWALTVINNARWRTLPIAIANIQGQWASDWGLIFAASLIAVLPVLALCVSLHSASSHRDWRRVGKGAIWR